jgi:hypothetical protein
MLQQQLVATVRIGCLQWMAPFLLLEPYVCLFLVGCRFRVINLKRSPPLGTTTSSLCCPDVTDELV